jgi:imidazolonepropionase-like amidohydrolase
MKKNYLFILITLFQYNLIGQIGSVNNGIENQAINIYAIVNATTYINPDTKIEKCTLIIKNDILLNIGSKIDIPTNAIILDYYGSNIYPSFVETFTNFGVSEPRAEGSPQKEQPQLNTKRKGAFSWNEALRPDFESYKNYNKDDKMAEEYRSIGFGTVLGHRMDGIARGTGVTISLNMESSHKSILKNEAANFYSFKKGTSNQSYPSSLMGCIALLRQAHLDADYYAKEGNKNEKNISLQAWNDNKSLKNIFAVDSKQEAIRVFSIGKEFNENYIIKGAGDEYQRIEELKKVGKQFIIPVNFPENYDVADIYDAWNISYDKLKHWELAPYNPMLLDKNGFELSLTTYGLKAKSDFFKQIIKAIKRGWTEKQALQALTINPAKIAGVDSIVGTLEKGKLANFIVTSGNIFDENTIINQNWIQGKMYIIKPFAKEIFAGEYDIQFNKKRYQLIISKDKNTIKTVGDTAVSNLTIDKTGNSLKFVLEENKQNVRFQGILENDLITGYAISEKGEKNVWYAKKIWKELKNENEAPKIDSMKYEMSSIIFPFAMYGNDKIPKAKSYLITNATIWTNEKEGIIKNSDLIVQNGKITKIGKELICSDCERIDATNKHVTAGIIDEHSHIAISRGVNEGTEAVTSEVRIGDVLDSDDENIFLQLAGGVTSSHLLHGSANPIGGQTQLIKLRWGYSQDELKFENWPGFIKFALGENVKQSNWGDDNTTRYPQTRMGVEQIIEDAFLRAEKYKILKNSKKVFRQDLELDALEEILDKKRFITCHSYQQGEINMLMKLAERHNFKINTFTHILEGYKVADKMKKYGVAAAGFADWWAYKYEVIDAIPYNGALLHSQGVLTAFNSDDAEMARRLNQEAAKAVKYGGVSEEDAWKFVTLNPAKMLHVDNKVGSLLEGKDADIVVWSDNPLSVYAKAMITIIDGVKFYDRNESTKKYEETKTETERIIRLMLQLKTPVENKSTSLKKDKSQYHCDDVKDEMK